MSLKGVSPRLHHDCWAYGHLGFLNGIVCDGDVGTDAQKRQMEGQLFSRLQSTFLYCKPMYRVDRRRMDYSEAMESSTHRGRESL